MDASTNSTASYICSKPLPRIAGMLSKKEKRAAVSLFNPINKPPVIVVPEREEPGINASACAKPITRVSIIVTSVISFLNFAVFSAMARIIARPIRLPAITLRSFVNAPSITSLNNKPIITTGTEPIIISQPRRESLVYFLKGVSERFCFVKAVVMFQISFLK